MIMQGDYTESDDIMIKRIFQRHILRLIYNSLIHPHLLSGLNLWGFKHKRITMLQKKAVRIIAF